jgi:hypothetical protein
MLATFVVTGAIIGGVFYLNQYYQASILSINETSNSITYTFGDFSDNFYDDPSIFYVVLENETTTIVEPFDIYSPSGSFTNLMPNTSYQLKLIIQDGSDTVTIVETEVKTNLEN